MRLPDLLNRFHLLRHPTGGWGVAVRNRWSMAQAVNRMGWPGLVGLGLLVFSAAFYFSWLQPVQDRLETLRQEAVRGRGQNVAVSASQGPQSTADGVASFYLFFPRVSSVHDQLEKIYNAADRQSLKLDQGDYRPVRDSVGKLVRYQITLPVKGAYPQIRRFIGDVLSEIPSVALDNIQFERQKVGDATVDAKIKLVMYLEEGP